jgi:ABC-2 type transport system permease protein
VQPADSPNGVIHDIGYQRYTGVRLGRGYAARSLFTHGVRTVFGFGRSAKAKIFPWFVVGILFVVATVDVAVRSQTNVMPITYLSFTNNVTLLLVFFVAAAAPELLSRDLRSNVLPLYFSRPLRRTDYAWAKFAALVTALWLIIAGPLLLIFIGGAFSLPTWHQRGHEFGDFLGGLGLGAICAVVFAAFGLVISSFLSRRMVAAAVIVGYFLVTAAVSVAVGQIIGGTRGKGLSHLLNPGLMLVGLKEWLFRIHGTDIEGVGPVFLLVTVAFTALAAILLLLRYRKVSV